MAADKSQKRAALACFIFQDIDIDRRLRKGLNCRYRDSSLDAAKRYVHLDCLNPIAKSSLLLMNTFSYTDLSHYIPADEFTGIRTVDEFVYAQVHRLILGTGRLLGNIIEQFFHGIYRFVPVVSRMGLQQMLRDFGLFLLHNWYVTRSPNDERKLIPQGSHFPAPRLITDPGLEKIGEDTTVTIAG
ncbi:hypothetical protein N7486_009680 [Penicillium sp. IBT 16267x]|nr:hypothetical protein N7486_009680 [Penicillium sp. IBT 16267x]